MATLESEEYFLAGHLAPAGRYRRIEPPDGRLLILERDDVLPGSLDGHIALYERLGTVAAPATVSALSRARRVGSA